MTWIYIFHLCFILGKEQAVEETTNFFDSIENNKEYDEKAKKKKMKKKQKKSVKISINHDDGFIDTEITDDDNATQNCAGQDQAVEETAHFFNDIENDEKAKKKKLKKKQKKSAKNVFIENEVTDNDTTQNCDGETDEPIELQELPETKKNKKKKKRNKQLYSK